MRKRQKEKDTPSLGKLLAETDAAFIIAREKKYTFGKATALLNKVLYYILANLDLEIMTNKYYKYLSWFDVPHWPKSRSATLK